VLPLISVILSVYNCEQYVEESINSILNQSFNDFELIIIDDASRDKSSQICQSLASKDPRIIFIQNKRNLGGCETLNVGLKYAHGKYIARQDNDDWSYPFRLQKQFDFMEANPDVGILGGNMELINESGKLIGHRHYHQHNEEIRKHIFRYSPFSHPLTIFRKSALDRYGHYNHEYAPADDYELYLRIGQSFKFANLPMTLMRYRILPNSLTNSRTLKMEKSTIKVRELYFKNASYCPTVWDMFYNLIHKASIYLIPPKIKMRLFNILRNE
jgi:glycosyltransferase involved in cell wall biosynthesis